MPVKPPLQWDAYQLFRQRFIEAIKFQRAFTAKLRADGKLPREKRTFLQRFIDALVGENVGVSKGKGAKPRYVDQLVSEANPTPGQPPQVDVFSVKQRNVRNVTAEDLESIFDTDADEAVTNYGGIIEVRRPGHPLFGKQVQVTRVHLIYDARLKPIDPEVLGKALASFRNSHPGIEILFQ